MISALVLSLLVASASCASGVVPTFPGPGQAFKEGGDCPISWNLDTTGKWTNFSVDLMSGSNFAMQTVSNVFKDRDGTKGETTYTWKCPTVTPTSAIYFYQFTQTGADTTWTTRFAITSPSGESTPPANQTQPGGAQIPWGVGHLAGAGAEPAPASPATTAPSATANITALNTPSPATTNATNSTTGSLAGANTTSSTTGTPAATSSGSATSGSSSSGSYSKNPASASPSNSRPTNPSSNTTSTPSAGAHTVALCQNVAAVLTLAAVLIVS